jgi:hypothetical protein
VIAVEARVTRALLDALAEHAGVKAALGDPVRIKEGDGDMPAFPYLEMREHDSRPAGSAGVPGSEHFIDLSVASRNDEGMGSMEGIASVRTALEDIELVMTGWRCVLIRPLYCDMIRGSPGAWRTIMRIQIVVEAAS